jgi:hypothetical protein
MAMTQPFVNPYYLEPTDGSPGYHMGDAFAGVGAGPMPYLKETASQAYVAGDLVYLDSNGTVAICTKTSNKLNSSILGIALRAASGTTGMPVYVRPIRPCDLYVMNVFHGTPASSVTAQTQLGLVYGIFNTTTTSGKWCVDIQNTTTEDGSTALAKVQVVGFPVGTLFGNLQTIGDTNGFVIVRFLTETTRTDGSNKVRNLQLL